MPFAPIVVEVMKGDSVPVISPFLAKCIGQSGKTPILHAYSEILPLNIARTYAITVGIS